MKKNAVQPPGKYRHSLSDEDLSFSVNAVGAVAAVQHPGRN